MRNRISLILACLFMSIGWAVAQNTISGTVVDGENNEPIIGASVFIKGTKVGTVTDIDGHFTLNASTATPTLEISYIGMKKVTVKGGKNIKVTMFPDAGTLEEVVVTGMQQILGGTCCRCLRAECVGYLWYRTQNQSAWSYFHLWQFITSVGGRRCDHGRCRQRVGRRPLIW